MNSTRGYAEMETGTTLLAFTSEQFLDDTQLIGGIAYRANRPALDPVGAHLAFVTDEIERDWNRAVAEGATLVKMYEPKPWGQTAGYLRDLDGILIELCTPATRG